MTDTPNNPPATPQSPPQIPASIALRHVTVESIHWPSVLDFTHLFGGFRLAINPAKLAIALLAILMIYTAGRLFDAIWGPQVYRDEISRFVSERPEVYKALRKTRLDNRSRDLDSLLADDHDLTSTQRVEAADNPSRAYTTLKAFYKQQFDSDLKAAAEHRAESEKSLAPGDPPFSSSRTPAEIEQEDRARASARLLGSMQHLSDVRGKGIFDSFLHFETSQFDLLVENTLSFVRITPVRSAADAFSASAESQTVSGGLLSRDPQRIWRSDTVAGCIANMTITGPRWLFTGTGPMQPQSDSTLKKLATRAAYLATVSLFALFSLLVIAFAGASIARLSALELAGIERAPLKDIFSFALQRLFTFVKAPLMPFIILLAVGLFVAVVSTIGAIPWIGPIFIGAALIAFLGICFILMLLLLGILGGFNLLYPTIAVEGADAFDAMSRSFAYVYARPWRLLFYTVTSLIYGVITFLFVAFAVYLLFLLTHTFVGWGMGLFGTHYGTYSGLPALETLWPSPQFLQLVHPINWYAMSWPEFLGALLLHFWTFLLIAGIGAYVLSYYFSSHTIIYLLLRRSVDGQGLKEIFLEK